MSDSEIDIAAKIGGYYKDCTKYNQELHERAVTNRGHYTGPGQWTTEDMAKLKKQKRLPLIINKIFRQVNRLSGIQRENRFDIRVSPRKGGNKPVAEVYTHLAKHAMDEANADFLTAYAYLLGLVEVCSYIGLEIDYTYDPLNGDIGLVVPSPRYMAVDPNCETYDMDDKDGAKYLFRGYYWTKEEIDLNYPDKAKDIGVSDLPGAEDTAEGTTSGLWEEVQKDTSWEPDKDYEGVEPAGHELKGHRYLIKDCWHKSNERYEVFYGKKERAGLIRLIDKKENDRLYTLAKRAAEKKPDMFGIKPIIVPMLHKTVQCGKIVLEDKRDPRHGIFKFPYKRFIPYYIDGEALGHVDNLISPQQELNKRRTQALGHLNSQHMSGLLVAKGTMSTQQKKAYKEMAATPGFIAEYNKEPAPTPVQPGQLSMGHMQMSLQAAQDMDDIGLVPETSGGMGEKGQSGRAIALRQTASIVTHAMITDNWATTYKSLAKDLIEMMMNIHADGTSIYTDEEIRYIIEEEGLVDKKSLTEAMKSIARENPTLDLNTLNPAQLAELDADIHKTAEAIFMRALHNPTILRYGVKVDKSANSPTIRIANFETLLEIAKLFQ